ncbi:MAG: ankyrin repeat domain-containing protein [Alphaproteobacteria bacterium]
MTTKLHQALLAGNSKAALALIDEGTPIDAQDDETQRTALMLAVAQSLNKVAEKLLDKGARIYLTDKFNRTALDMARDGGNEVGRNMLFRRMKKNELQAAMFHAAREGDTDTLSFLVDEMGLSLMDKSSRGKNALEEAEVCMQFDAAAYVEDKLAKFPDEAAQQMLKGARENFRPMKQISLKRAT